MAIKTGIANLPLHTGKAPRWLFKRMVRLGRAISEVIIEEYGKEEFLSRLTNPFFFQSFANVLAWDWHSSGATPVLCGALKEAKLHELGIIITGGKGSASRKTPKEIEEFGEKLNLSTSRIEKLKYSSKIIAKVDNSLVQDGYSLYTHSFIFLGDGRKYIVIQQGLNYLNRYARRYHWISDNIDSFVIEPHSAICGYKKEENVLDMTSRDSSETQKVCVDLVKNNPKHLEKYIKNPIQRTLINFEHFTMPSHHFIMDIHKRNLETLRKAHEIQPQNYEELVAIGGIGTKTIRSLALIADLIYGAKASWKDPVKYTFAHGGKDGVPRPVERELMDSNAEILKHAIKDAKLGNKEKLGAVRRLSNFYS
ncbi:DUF763 domain-containing protein [Candidatus Woesearchaeota archaeon]|nr:DUF763 domain-containing protein [Candidatus Woesearchaeota archaeon]